MAITETDFISKMKDMLRDDEGVLTDDQLKTHLQTAVFIYQRRKPFRKVHEISGDGVTYNFDVSTFTGWIEGFSFILKIQYPVETEGKPDFLSSKDWQTLEEPTKKVLRIYSPFASGKTARVFFAVPHTVSATESTVYASDIYPVSLLGASFACSALAGYYSQTAKSTLNVDVVDYFDKARLYSELKNSYKAEFDEMIPKGKAFAIGDFDIKPSWGTEDFMFHGEER